MSDVAVAMSEIVREGTWALRALGYPYGVAERAAGMLVWTEAVQGNALTLLRAGEAAIMRGAGRPAPRWSRGDDQVRRAEAGGKCLFECGPPALDLVTADARHSGIGRAVLTGVIGTRLAGSLAAIAARLGDRDRARAGSSRDRAGAGGGLDLRAADASGPGVPDRRAR